MGAQTRRKSVMSKIILVTGASSGFGRLTADIVLLAIEVERYLSPATARRRSKTR
jgi:NADP-dependent 3-hydroxy acid dehydrogenase YdfG